MLLSGTATLSGQPRAVMGAGLTELYTLLVSEGYARIAKIPNTVGGFGVPIVVCELSRRDLTLKPTEMAVSILGNV